MSEGPLPFPEPVADADAPSPPTTVEVGRRGEDLACRYLWRRGFRILERNFTGPGGEVDVIIEKLGRIRFVEVKTRSSESLGPPEERVDAEKRERLRKTASLYLERFLHPPEAGVQFDVLSQVVDRQGKVLRRELIENAF